ncbi:Hsp70 family protein [Georgenia yuyongxinii]|uniref:Hsp70 family protein n=1 Tax=Georgenia yuyongxinii TaxID=2589797 RepID=A0A552WPH4_9MICO|nr:Hsp70 family protein [Georgenia yuyongxinii]TRW44691.1 Hsp70 family protein [Georgenia yuyongxinii]
MTYSVGVDIGTSFVAAAITRIVDGRPQAPQPLHLGARSTATPSVMFFGDDGQVLVGDAAERRGTTDPDRVVRESKRRIGDSVPVVVGDLLVAPEDIYATMVRWVVDRADEQEGAPPDRVAVAHPVGWGAYKTGLIREALAGVGLGEVELISEPEAAALHYASFERVEVGSTIAVYDLGGGTFDVAILRKAETDTFDVLGRPEGIERLGGADFDEAVFRHVTAGLGEGFTSLDRADPGVLVALSRMRRECTEAKEALSSDSETVVPVLLPGMQTQVRLVRSEFEELIAASVRDTVASVEQALRTAQVEREDLTAVLLIGGSSRVPLVAQLLSAELGRPIAVDADPKASICLGASLAAAYPGAIEGTAVVLGDDDVAVAPVRAQAGDGVRPVTEPPSPAGAAPASAATAFVAKARHQDIGSRRGIKIAAIAGVVASITVFTTVVGQTPEVQELIKSSLRVSEAQAGTPAADGGEAVAAGEDGRGGASGEGASSGRSGVARLNTVAPKPGDPTGKPKPTPTDEASTKVSAAGSPTTGVPGTTSTGGKTTPGTNAPGGPAAGDGGTGGAPTGGGTPAGGSTPSPNPTTPSPGPTTPSPGPTTPSPDPTTPSPDPTTPSPDPTTPSPDPTTEPPPEPEPTATATATATEEPSQDPPPPADTPPAEEPPATGAAITVPADPVLG